jgi:hypothetical protein
MVGPHVHARPRLSIDGERRELDVSEPSHTKLSQRTACRKATWHVGAKVEHSSTIGQLVHPNPQFSRPLDTPIRQVPGALVHTQVCHTFVAEIYAKNDPNDSNDPNDPNDPNVPLSV